MKKSNGAFNYPLPIEVADEIKACPTVYEYIEQYVREYNRPFLSPKHIAGEINLPNDKKIISHVLTKSPQWERHSNTTFARI